MTTPLKILLLSAEIAPFAKVGGLADVAGALPKALRALGHDVRVAMPRYSRVDALHFNLQKTLETFPVPLDRVHEDAAILEGKLDGGVPAYFIENKKFFDREGIYMYPDDAERFIFFSRAALEMCKRINFKPDVIHCHDWHTALVPNWLGTIYASDSFFANTATVYTIHNIAYQGVFGHRVLEIAGLAPYGFIAHPETAPELREVIDFMARGILFADKINAVSETYAREILTPEYGEKLDPILRDRQEHLVGILNGLDTETFNPARDPHIAKTFDANTLDARAANKTALQNECGLPQSPNAPILAMMTRLSDQKGIDLVADALHHILDNLPLQFILMGTGDQHYHDFFTRLQQKYPDRVAILLTWNPVLERKIAAGADMLLMPSRSEPSGTHQLIAMRYGCLPIVRVTGGLKDTVLDYDARANAGTGFGFHPSDRWAMYTAIVRAVQTFEMPRKWRQIQQRAMAQDFSWHTAALRYQKLYHAALEQHQRATLSVRRLADDLHRTHDKITALPKRIARLGELAYNLWWSWNPAGRGIFEHMDPRIWQTTQHNPVQFLRELSGERLQAACRDENFLRRFDDAIAAFDAYHGAKATWFNTNYPYAVDHPIAYFSAEFGLHESLPIYSGGLGILSGDHTKEASDLGLPLVGVGFLYPQGYFTQEITADGTQNAQYAKLNLALAPAVPAKMPDGREVVIGVGLPGRSVYAKVWRVQVGRVPLFLLDTDFEANALADRELLARLYQGDQEQRIAQEIMLGVGGVRALRALGIAPRVWHLNEGHSAFSVLERARELMEAGRSFNQAREAVRATTAFTTHTPVPAGNDAFPFALMEKYFGTAVKRMNIPFEQFFEIARQADRFSMTVLALKFAGYANGVSQLHGQVARRIWQFLWQDRAEQDVPIDSITNGVHAFSWLAPEYQTLYDEFFPRDWRARVDDAALWEYIEKIPDERLWATHCALKEKLFAFVVAHDSVRSVAHARAPLPAHVLTLGFARRFATYKRATLMFRDVEHMKRILNNAAQPVQILFAGKAHPADEPGKEFIKQVVQFTRAEGFAGKILFLEDYDIDLARRLVQGVDVWVNTPRRPLEASGTSGMKAALNGALNFSVLDGWWREGFLKDANGWAIGADQHGDDQNAQDAADAESCYATLENEIVPLFYTRDGNAIPREWVRRMKQAIQTIAPRFSARRMVKEYVTRYYVPAATDAQK